MSNSRMCFFYFILVLLLSSCATLPPEAPAVKQAWKNRQIQANQISSWHINGKIAILTSRDSGSATVDWAQNHQQFVIELFGPLGMNGLKLTGQPGQVTLKTSDGKSLSASNPEELLDQQWGWKLPVSNLKYWIRGLPVPGIPKQTEFDAYQRLTRLSQANWEIQYSSYTNLSFTNLKTAQDSSVDLPTRISITSPNFKTKIVIYSWQVS